MNEKRKKLFGISLVFIGLILLVGCSDSGGKSTSTDNNNPTGTGDALAVGSKVSVVQAKESTTTVSTVSPLALNAKAIQAAINTGSFGADSDYRKDKTQIYVHEESAAALDVVNSLLCPLDQTQYDEMVNKGNYRAQVDDSQCEDRGKESNDDSSGDQSGDNQVKYSTWIVNSFRANNNSPHIVKAWTVWIESDTEDSPIIVKLKMTIKEGSSSENSTGIFRLDYATYMVGGNSAIVKGVMFSERESDGQVAIKFRLFSNYEGFQYGANIARNVDGTRGSGSTSLQMTTPEDQFAAAYNFSFNNDYFYRKKLGGSQICLNRNDFFETVWRYGLYDAKGARVRINSGFPIRYESGGKAYHGWIGYWGLWMPKKANIANGSVVIKEEYGSGNTEQKYTVFIAGGKLRRHTKKELAMSEIENIPLAWWDRKTKKDYQVLWNGSNLVKVAERGASTNWRWSQIATENITFSAGDYEFYFYSKALGGDGQIKFDNWENINKQSNVVPIISTDSKVIVNTHNTVFPGDAKVPSTVACFDSCPDPDKLNQPDPFFPKDNSSSGKLYTFEDGILKHNGKQIVVPKNSQHNKDGVRSGALFGNTLENLAEFKCPWDDTKICPWRAGNKLKEHYTWSTGPNDWQMLTTLKSGDKFLKFDSPMQIKYTRQSGNKNTTYYLEYQGFGNLFGIPEKCVNKETGTELDCWTLTEQDYQSDNIRWIHRFVIPNGTTASGTDETEYVIKALEGEQLMKVVGDEKCTEAGLKLVASRPLPDAGLWTDPGIGDMPTVAGAAAVVGGVVQK